MENVISKLRDLSKYFPEDALNEAIEKKEEITPILLEELDKIIANPKIVLGKNEYMLHIYSVFLLARFREKAAFPKIVKLFSFSPDKLDIMFGDIVTENLSSILYSTFDGDLNLLKKIIENPKVDMFVRGAALDVYGKLYSDGIVSKEEIIKYLKKLIHDIAYDEDFDLATDIQVIVMDWHIFEMLDEIQLLYDQGRIDTTMVGEYDSFIDEIYSYKYESNDVKYIDDISKEMSWWVCFEKTPEQKKEMITDMKKIEKLINKEKDEVNKIKGKSKKVGRNDPCPCGSGKKYKKCCLDKESKDGVRVRNEFLESVEEQKRWLKDYPLTEGERVDGQIRISDVFDRESIEIDKLVYLALHYRPIPIWINRDEFREEMVMISYLSKAFEKFQSKCEKEGITTFEDYDKKYKIHYDSEYWIYELEYLISKNDLEDKYEKLLEEVENITASF